ncbi:MAG TPA: hypothetical protein VHE53_05390 [Patescibacteria group bacterium]|nr:hypothetical protein [Patescibacteria group bacterium]
MENNLPKPNPVVANPAPQPSTTPANTPTNSSSNGIPKAAIIALVIASVVVFIALIIAGYELFIANKTAKTQNNFVTNQVSETGNSSIAGTLGIDGAPPQGSTVTILARKSGQNSFKPVVTGITPLDGATWAWNDAGNGVAYEIQAQVKVNGQNIGTSPIETVVAPATSEVLNVNITLPSPTQSPTVTPGPTPTPVLSSISGTFNLNGYIPSGTTITLQARQVGTTSFTTVQSNLPAVDNSNWTWTNAIQNASYEVQAIMSNNYGTSQVLTITAPATSEVLTINSTAQPPAPTVSGVSGTINLNGNAPSGSYITLGSRVTGTSSFNQVASNISATNGVAWSWNNAQAGTSYDFQAYLWVNGQPASQSQILTVEAPATGEVLTINAQTQASAPNGNTLSVSCNNNPGSGFQATINFNLNNSLQNAQQYWLTVGTTGGGSQIVNNILTPSNPSQQQSYTTSPSLSQGQTYYAQYAYSTCANCNTFSSFSTSIPFTCN